MARKLIGTTRKRRSSSSSSVVDFTIDTFSGLANAVKDLKQIAKGAASDMNNWITAPLGDHIELRMGTLLLTLTRQPGAGKIVGLGVATRNDGTQIPFWAENNGKVKYYNPTTKDSAEVGSNLLPTAAKGEDVAFSPYSNLAGSWMFLSSRHSSIYKIPVANPASAVDQSSLTYRGLMKIKQNRMFTWNNNIKSSGANDWTGLNLSYIDKTLYSQYTTVSGESVGTGDGVTKTFSGTLAARTGARTVFLVQITDTNESFLDDKNGNLVGSLGGTGTINYATGAYSVTFNTAPVNSQAITATYQWEDSTSAGICDFSFSNPRTTGQGDYFAQADGGSNFMNLFTFGGDEYCMHPFKTWILTLTADDTKATNLLYRAKVGIPYWKSGVEIGEGVAYLDFNDKSHPKFRVLTYAQASSVVIPSSLSDAIDLSNNGFDQPIVFDFSDYYILCCQSIINGVNAPQNNVMYIYNKFSKFWDKLDYPATYLEIYNQTLISGDPLTNNIFTLFSGYDDDGVPIANFWNSGLMDLGVRGRKRFLKLIVDGYINPSQTLNINLSFDNGSLINVGVISGNGSYVDFGSGILVGANATGSQIVGSTSGSPINAYHFRREFTIASQIFEYCLLQFQAMGIGALQVNEATFQGIRFKGIKVSPQYYTS